MKPDLYERSAAILDHLLALPEAERTKAWAGHPECEPEVRAEVNSLLAACEASSGYLEGNVVSAVKPGLGTQIGPWKLVDQIGQGGMSFVFRGERVSGYDQRVAIKIIALPVLLTGAMAHQIQSRFESERQIVARLEHPNICKLLDGGLQTDGTPYLVLEYVEGEDFLSYARRVPLANWIGVLEQVALAVHYAHQRLVVHRDLKPSNILVTADGHPKLLDFGIAKSLDPGGLEIGDERTATFFRAATPAYASPEQMRGEPLTTATDIYSLGVLLSKLLPDTREADLSAIAAKATREDAKDRYDSAADLAADLACYRKGLPVEARRGNVRYVVYKFIRRHVAAVSMAILAIMALLTAVGLTLVKNQQVLHERERAATVASFLQSLFQASDPEVNQGNRLTIRQLLDQGAKSIQSSALDTDARAELTQTMAEAYAGLGLFNEAIRLYESMIQMDSADSRRTVHALSQLANAQAQLGQHEPAVKNALQATATARRLRPTDPGAEAEALEQHCLAQYMAANYAQATPLCAEAVKQAERASLPSLNLAHYLRSLGRAQKNIGDFAGAEASLKRSLNLAQSVNGRNNPTAAIALDELGGLFFRQGKFLDSIRFFDQALAQERKLYPEGHVSVARTLNNIANTQTTLRQFKESIATYQSAHELYRKFLGDDSAELAVSMSNLAIAQQSVGQLDAAAVTLEKVRDVHEQTTGKDKQPYWNTQLKIANLRLEQDRPQEALQLAAEVVSAMDNLNPKPRVERGFARIVLATALVECGRAHLALAPATEAQSILSQALAPGHWMRAYGNAVQASALVAHGKRSEAKKLLEPLYREVAMLPGKGSWRAEWMKKLWRTNRFDSN